MPFVPLLNRSAFTFYSGAMDVAGLVEACARTGHGAAGICDRDGLCGAVRFTKACRAAGIRPVLGAEITAPGRGEGGERRGNKEKGIGDRGQEGGYADPHPSSSYTRSPLPAPRSPLFAFARTNEGYARLCALITRRKLEPERFDRTTEAAAAAEGGHLVLVVSDPALLVALQGAGAPAESLFARLSGDPALDGPARAAAQWLGLPLLAAPLASFASPGGFAVHRVLRAIKHLRPEVAPGDFLLSAREAAARFAGEGGVLWGHDGVLLGDTIPIQEDESGHVPAKRGSCPQTKRLGASASETRRALDLSGELASQCDAALPLGDWLLPHPPIPPGESEAGRLRAFAYAGLARRVRNVTGAYLARMERELEVIVRLSFAGYFLVVEDIARFAREVGTPNIGRGSGAGSLVSYCLALTQVDPVQEGLYFERFLNPGRRNPPDIDLDFSWRERDEVIRHVYDTYGDGNVCMIATHNTFSARSAFREVGKALGVPEEEIGILARAVPHADFDALPAEMARRPESRKFNFMEEPWRTVLDVARSVDGFPRHLSVHCGGVVVSPIRLTRRLSLERAAKGVAITQGDMVDVEDLGLVKIDLLGNRSLGVLSDAVAAVEDHTGKRPQVFPPERTFDDRATNALIASGSSMGCFYIESPGMRLLLQRLGTRTFRDLTAVSSIIRPGVSESGMMEAYIARRLGEQAPRYAHPGLEPILRETFGVMVYQEDVIRVAHEFVGLSLGEADLLRRAMSGKYRSRREMDSLTDSFFQKGSGRGIARPVLEELWGQIRSFAGYAFCKAHSASFAQLSYQVAYLKAHHPAEFFAALVNNRGGFYGTAAYVEEARRRGLVILPPDVNASETEFAGRGNLLRCGFFSLRDVRPSTMDALYEERGEGAYRSFADLCARLRRRVHPAELETLVRAGACDGYGPHRGFLLWLLHAFWPDVKEMKKAESGEWRVEGGESATAPSLPSSILLHLHSGSREQEAGSETKLLPPGFFPAPSSRLPAPPPLPSPLPPPPSTDFDRIVFEKRRYLPNPDLAAAWHREAKSSHAPDRPLSLAELLAGESRALGFCATAHPLAPMLEWAADKGLVDARSLAARAGSRARIWGQVIAYKRIPTRKTKEGMAFATLEDPTGLSELVFFPGAYRAFGELLTRGKPLVVEGMAKDDRGGLTMIVERAWAVRGVTVRRPVEVPDEGSSEGIA